MMLVPIMVSRLDKVFPHTIPIRKVDASGNVAQIGVYNAKRKVLELSGNGFPFLTSGTHALGHDDDLPWVFQDMAPSGFLGRLVSRAFPDLGLPTDSRIWRLAHTLATVLLSTTTMALLISPPFIRLLSIRYSNSWKKQNVLHGATWSLNS